jgi:NFU1 iron-sulfur cluster scaffold homolog, mitochondrial
MNMSLPVTVYAEYTPNPATMKFVANKNLIDTDQTVDFKSASDAKAYSPLAEALLSFPFVNAVFISSNFVSVTKTDNVPWDFITADLREFVQSWLLEEKAVVTAFPEKNAFADAGMKKSTEGLGFDIPASEFDDAISDILNEYVRPRIEMDGGAIDYLGFLDGTVSVVLKGSCAGCPSSTATLKFGIENLLKEYIPEVKEVRAING